MVAGFGGGVGVVVVDCDDAVWFFIVQQILMEDDLYDL